MNRIVLTITIVLSILHNAASAQSCMGPSKTVIIEPYHLPITVNKTTTLIFPYSIKSVDRGSRDVLAQKANGIENVLLVKAGRENFPETNLSIITSDGKLYSILLTYSNNPYPLNLSFTKDTIQIDPFIKQAEYNEMELEVNAGKISIKERTIHGIQQRKYKVLFRLSGIYIKGDVFYFQMEVQNRSGVNYEMERVRFFIRDEKKYKRTASQEIELQPLYVHGDTATIKNRDRRILVFALPKFTIGDQKNGSIELIERNGTRLLDLKVRNHTLINTKTLEE
jgi:conjugative transposon TraN protein